MARGSIVDSGNVNVFNKQKTSFRYRLLPQLAPKAKLIVSYTNKEFLIFDELDLDFDVFNNDVCNMGLFCSKGGFNKIFNFSLNFRWITKSVTIITPGRISTWI